MHNLAEKILSDPINKWVFTNAKTGVFLVGGYLRDILFGRTSMDIDYIVETNAREIALKTANKFNGTHIVFKDQVHRIILKNKRVIDFTQFEGPIYNNLSQRDFTINAIAWSPETGIIDPFMGLNDLKRGLVKTVVAENIENDPLRVLRAYRHAAQLSFTIEKNTIKYLKLYAAGIIDVAPERITNELFKILNNERCGYYLIKCYRNSIIERVIELDKERLRENLRLVNRYDAFIKRYKKKINNFFKKKISYEFLSKEINQGITREGLIRLALLLVNGQHVIEKDKPLRFSRAIKKALRDIHRGYKISNKRITDKRLFEIFTASGESLFEMALILSIKKEQLERFLNRADEFRKIKSKPLLNGSDIQNILNCGQGAIIGKIQSFLQEAQFLGKVKTKADAKTLILSNFT